MLRATPALAFAACLFAPLAAAGGHATEGHLHMDGGVAMRGRLDLQGPGLLEVDRSSGDGMAVAFAGLVQGVLVERTRDNVHLGLPGAEEASVSDPQSTSAAIAADGAGRVENVRCGNECQVALSAEPGDGLLGIGGPFDAPLKPTAEDRTFSTTPSTQVSESQWRSVVPAGSVEASAGQFAGAAPSASGRVTLVLADAAFDLVAGGKRTTVDARWWNETTSAVAGQPVQVRHHARHAVLVLDGAGLALAPGARFRVSFPAGADGSLDGALSTADASGVLTVAGKRHDLDHASVALDGLLAMRLEGRHPGPLGGPAALDVGVQGEATRALVAGASIVPRFPASAVEAGGGVLALVGLAALGRFLVAPLYHRLAPSDLLANPNRRRIHDAIRARPGIDVGALVAAAGLSRVLVRHHLRMLEVHGLVRATAWRRRRTYALVGAGAGAGLAACELKDATRRRIALAVARAGGATQKDLSRALGLSQRLVSYHLACLGDSALVRAEGSNPRVYVATPALAHALAGEEGLGAEKDGALARLGKEGEGAVVAAVATPA
jgi:predicted transcriptional regulator